MKVEQDHMVMFGRYRRWEDDICYDRMVMS